MLSRYLIAENFWWCKFCRNASRPFLLFSWNAYHSITFTRTFGLPLWVVQICEELTCWRGRFNVAKPFCCHLSAKLKTYGVNITKIYKHNGTNLVSIAVWFSRYSCFASLHPVHISKSVSCVFPAARSGLTQEKQLYPKNTMYRHQTCTIMPARICRFQWYQHCEHSA